MYVFICVALFLSTPQAAMNLNPAQMPTSSTSSCTENQYNNNNEMVMANSNGSSIRYPYLPSLIECDDTDLDDIMMNDVVGGDSGGGGGVGIAGGAERTTNTTTTTTTNTNPSIIKKDNGNCKGTYNFISKALSEAMDARLEMGLNLQVELDLRRVNLALSLSLFSALPQVMNGGGGGDVFHHHTNTNIDEIAPWPKEITEIWSGTEYNCSLPTYSMFKHVFDSILADLHLQQTWVHMEQVLHMWLTLNAELMNTKGIQQGGSCSNNNSNDVGGGGGGTGVGGIGVNSCEELMPKISFGANAVRGLLMALAWHNDVKLRTWSLGFQCLLLSCNTPTIEGGNMMMMMTQDARIDEVIINDDNFEKMLLRFFSGYGMSSSIITNRYVSI